MTMSNTNAFMGLDPEKARKVAKHLKGSGEEIQHAMRDILAYFHDVEWTGGDMHLFHDDLKTMANKVGGQAVEMGEHAHTVEDRIRKQEDASRDTAA